MLIAEVLDAATNCQETSHHFARSTNMKSPWLMHPNNVINQRLIQVFDPKHG